MPLHVGPPPTRFANRLACIEVNSVIFEQGYDEQFVEGGITSHQMCSICRGLQTEASVKCGRKVVNFTPIQTKALVAASVLLRRSASADAARSDVDVERLRVAVGH